MTFLPLETRKYPAILAAVHDGDTVHCAVDLGIDITVKLTLRFAGINAPELATPAGIVARDYVTANLPPGAAFYVLTTKDRKEKYGRYLAWLVLPDGRCINRMLVDSGNAVAYGNLPVDPP